ncbi:hypothetical protein IFU08_12390 [Microbacterium sp. CFBP 8790]|nr:hypothetical protein [Microbacterium sp. CFBP 8790]MBD8207788.1 hypothetical protein [Microbacterium sp. CFBP 8801]MBD8510356.1 hypothetical protein [Microbacterium sp. CFBP 8790]
MFAQALDDERTARASYAESPTSSAHWILVDLRASGRYRVTARDEAAFTRARMLVDVVTRISEPYGDRVRIFKEMGDAVLLCSSDPRCALEILVLLNLVDRHWRIEYHSDSSFPPLEYRAYWTFGDATEFAGDYYGVPLDILGRISAFKGATTDAIAVVHTSVNASHIQKMEFEYPFVKFGYSFPLPERLSKSGEQPIRIFEVAIDTARALGFTNFFSEAKKMSAKVRL